MSAVKSLTALAVRSAALRTRTAAVPLLVRCNHHVPKADTSEHVHKETAVKRKPPANAEVAMPASGAAQDAQRVLKPEEIKRGVAFQEMLVYLQERHGVHHTAQTLTEMAHILGYEHVAADTKFSVEDSEILLQEIGATDHPVRDLMRFLRARKRTMEDGKVAPIDPEELEAWQHIANGHDLLQMCRRKNAVLEQAALNPAWLRVTLSDGNHIFAKWIGPKDSGKGKHKEYIPTHKEDGVTVHGNVEEATEYLFQKDSPGSSPSYILFEPETFVRDHGSAGNKKRVGREIVDTPGFKDSEIPDIEDYPLGPEDREVSPWPQPRKHPIKKMPLASNINTREHIVKTGPRRRGKSETGHVHGHRSSRSVEV
eukprot:CAMPEP_0206576244 /NCGR_PEP_ID=MMETSP0325_2-20121206/30618_1 /ASSEMBLY_ACC=CAM_ASM_000347 /TAXON_ID=2866 /ORGANISM="Crypthecodinium cohnii, Strain Seligo" /LENGTH=368 /DNA_ID=CAMNT_0054081387 /DNA_START=68 /DNA_END=1174 /DNA_ORIENTATION=-